MLKLNINNKLPEQGSPVSLRLRVVRQLFGYRQWQVAKLLHVDRSTYSNYELGKSIPPLSAIIALSNHYKVSTDYLLGLGDDEDIFKPPYTSSSETIK